MSLDQWLKSRGFASFTVVHDRHQTYENKPVNRSGIRIEICDDVASIWCATLRVNHLAINTTEVQSLVDQLLKDLDQLAK